MSKLITLLTLLIISSSAVMAQKLIIGEKAPDLKVEQWLNTAPQDEGKARLVEFFYSASAPSVDRLAIIDSWALKYNSKLTVIVITKEPKAKVESILAASSRSYYSAIDDAGKSFAAYSVQFVPFSVLIDAKGKVSWFGNSTSLDEAIINKYLK